MDTNDNGQEFEESLRLILQTLPAPIREYVAQGTYRDVVKRLMATYALHIDQGGALEQNVILLLLGIDDPDAFAAALKDDAGIPENVVTSIMTDLNAEIFVPLRDQMEKGADTVPFPPAPPQPVSVQAGIQKPRLDLTPSSFAPPLQSPRYNLADDKNAFVSTVSYSPATHPAPHHTAPAVPKAAAEVPPPPIQAARPQPLSPKPLTENNHLLEDREEPHISFNRAATPIPQRMAPPPVNLPGAMPSINRITPPAPPVRFAPPAPPPPIRIVPQAVPQPPKASAPIAPPPPPPPPAKPYSTDPYREPLA